MNTTIEFTSKDLRHFIYRFAFVPYLPRIPYLFNVEFMFAYLFALNSFEDSKIWKARWKYTCEEISFRALHVVG